MCAQKSCGRCPLTLDGFWGPMAYVLIGGLAVGTAITLLFVPALYALSAALLGFAAFDARRRRRDPRELARTGAIGSARQGVEGAGDAAVLGRVLRELVATQPEAAQGDYDGLIAECDALRFAPGGEQAAVPAPLRARAIRFLEALDAGEGE